MGHRNDWPILFQVLSHDIIRKTEKVFQTKEAWHLNVTPDSELGPFFPKYFIGTIGKIWGGFADDNIVSLLIS